MTAGWLVILALRGPARICENQVDAGPITCRTVPAVEHVRLRESPLPIRVRKNPAARKALTLSPPVED